MFISLISDLLGNIKCRWELDWFREKKGEWRNFIEREERGTMVKQIIRMRRVRFNTRVEVPWKQRKEIQRHQSSKIKHTHTDVQVMWIWNCGLWLDAEAGIWGERITQRDERADVIQASKEFHPPTKVCNRQVVRPRYKTVPTSLNESLFMALYSI